MRIPLGRHALEGLRRKRSPEPAPWCTARESTHCVSSSTNGAVITTDRLGRVLAGSADNGLPLFSHPVARKVPQLPSHPLN